MSNFGAGKGAGPTKGYNYKNWYNNYPVNGFKRSEGKKGLLLSNLIEIVSACENCTACKVMKQQFNGQVSFSDSIVVTKDIIAKYDIRALPTYINKHTNNKIVGIQHISKLKELNYGK